MYAIEVNNLSKEYRLGELHQVRNFREAITGFFGKSFRQSKRSDESFLALNEVSFKVDEGEVLGVIGRNGAGKSTLLKILSKITHPTTGDIDINGRVASLLEVGTGFHEELTGRENIYLNGSILGMKKNEIENQFEQIVTFANVEKFLDTPIKRYSSGMRLRLGFAVAAHLSPDILLVDEVLAVGDSEFQKKCLNAMRDLHNVGRTVLFVSHNMAAVENLCDRCLWIEGGKIKQDGNSRDVIKNYHATFANGAAELTSFEQIKVRKGNGELKFASIEFLDAEYQKKNVICSGDPIVFRMHFHVHEKLINPHFGLELYSELGVMITSVNTWSMGFQIEKISPGRGFIDIKIDCLNFMPGRFYITLWAGQSAHLYDHLEHCAMFDLESADIYGTGKGVDSKFGLMYMNCDWSLNKSKGTMELTKEKQ